MSPKVTQAHQHARRQQILDAARSCFLKQGFHGTTMADISARAGLSAGAFYRYFEGKDDLVAAMCAESMERNRRRFGTVAGDMDTKDALESLTRIYFQRSHEPDAEDAARLTLQVWEESARSQRAGNVLRDDFAIVQAGLRDIVVRAQERGEIDPEQDPLAIAQSMMSMVLGLIVLRAAGCPVDVHGYEVAARAFVMGRIWTGAAGANQAAHDSGEQSSGRGMNPATGAISG